MSLPASANRSAPVGDPVATTADDVAALVLRVPGVAALHAGRLGEVATYLPGRRVTGVRLDTQVVEIHVVVSRDAPIRETARLIHEAVTTVIATPIQVYVEDITVA